MMKKIILIASIFLCCSVCQSASVAFRGSNGVPSEKSKAPARKGLLGDVFNIHQPSHQVCAGVNIHFVTGHENDLDMIAAAGFKFVRIDFGWQGTEREKGMYNWVAFDELTANLEKRGMGGIYIFDYSNSLYEESADSKNPMTGKAQRGTASPQHPESIAAFARWAAAAAEHFKGHHIIWEIWNEPNISFWKPKPDVAQYTALALATSRAVKAVVPGATIIGPASSELPWPFLESFLASGVLENLDAVSIHPYRNYTKSPETASADYQRLRGLIERHAPADKKNMPIISSEWGYSTATTGVTLEKQAAFIVRMQLTNLLSGIPISIWYDWKNDGNDPADHEQNFGTVTSDLDLKPAYKAVQTMNLQLKGFTLLGRVDVKNDHDYLLLFKNGKGKYMVSAWTTDDAHSVKIDSKFSGARGVPATDGNGNVIKPETAQQGSLTLNLSALPQYVALSHGQGMNSLLESPGMGKR